MIVIVIVKALLRLVLLIILAVLILAAVRSMSSPIYRFPAPEAFSGDSIYNPYRNYNPDNNFKKANFHAHAKAYIGITNGGKYIEEVVADYKSYGYDIIGISNYQTITQYDDDIEYHIPVYERGYNPLKYHHLIFGHNSMGYAECILPITNSACQSIINKYIDKSDAICINHPRFTLFFPVERMKYLHGYRFIEADAGMSPSFEWWDMGLSSGIPSFILSGDDSHDTSRPHDIATHATFIPSETTKYVDVMKTLKEGCSYSMKIPNFGNGDETVKHLANANLPKVENIGMINDTIHIKLSEVADSIKFIGQDGKPISRIVNSDSAEYIFTAADTYIRTEVDFANGIRIYTNPSFRYHTDDPFETRNSPIDWPLTILINLFRGAILLFLLYLALLLIHPLFR